MGVIWTSKTRTRQPAAAPRVNWANPLARGLRVVVTPSGGVNNLVTPTNQTSLAPEGIYHGQRALVWNKSGTYARLNTGVMIPTTTNHSFVALLTNTWGATSGTMGTLLSNRNGANNGFAVYLSAQNSLPDQNVQLNYVHGGIVDYFDVSPQISNVNTKFVTLGLSAVQGSSVRSFAEGAFVQSKAIGTMSGNNTDPLVIGTDFGIQHGDFASPLILWWSRALSDDEMVSVQRNPWQLFAPERTPVFYSLGSPPASPTIGAIWTSKTRTRQPSAPVGLAQNELTKSVIFAAPLGYDNRDVVSRTRLMLGAGYTTGVDERGLSGKSAGSSAFASFPLNLSAYTKLTVSFWMYWNGYANDDDMAMEFGSPTFSNNGFFIDPNSGSPENGLFQVAIGGSAVTTSGSFVRPSAGVWHHYMLGLDRTQGSAAAITMYVDGQLQTYTHNPFSVDIPNNFANSTLYIFGRNNASLFGAGRMQNLLIRGQVLPTDSLALAEYRNPWQLFAPERTPVFYSIAGVSPGPSTANRIMLLRRPGLSRIWR